MSYINTLENVLMTSKVFLADMDDFAKVNEVYGEYWGEPMPART